MLRGRANLLRRVKKLADLERLLERVQAKSDLAVFPNRDISDVKVLQVGDLTNSESAVSVALTDQKLVDVLTTVNQPATLEVLAGDVNHVHEVGIEKLN